MHSTLRACLCCSGTGRRERDCTSVKQRCDGGVTAHSSDLGVEPYGRRLARQGDARRGDARQGDARGYAAAIRTHCHGNAAIGP